MGLAGGGGGGGGTELGEAAGAGFQAGHGASGEERHSMSITSWLTGEEKAGDGANEAPGLFPQVQRERGEGKPVRPR